MSGGLGSAELRVIPFSYREPFRRVREGLRRRLTERSTAYYAAATTCAHGPSECPHTSGGFARRADRRIPQVRNVLR
ncbi:hypothetical protein [Paenibacillus xylanexedens]|uniref:hypothetical protein n=1 Tax=Paenibacillus xylanexedens TaxID=528191 RepID=UPI0021B586C2|nr:hypothetical protein [Paenibacillus xylanexedens]